MAKITLKKFSIVITFLVFLLLQAVKPVLIIFIYKTITNFHPTIMNDYEIYQMVIKYILQGSMKFTYVVMFVILEILFLSVPIILYKKLSNSKQKS
ncbi:hypothetical protein SAMN05444853_10548 [Pasteurella skyensis]|uniref:Uncharacterized protein n=1 Tax=Phocoenobacter skyensis TaxID=97481 RepID=A0A1H7VPS1_9PAST|nr:hypothetical protein SAMN05444853_10548 [Pasteurella skyensis]